MVVSHDAGGSEIISSWVAKHSSKHVFAFLLEGPAIAVFGRKLGSLTNQTRSSILSDLSTYSFILTGTSWASDLEKTIISLAKSQRIPCATYLDHWMDYRKRFESGGKLVLPDEIWVGDVHAYRVATETFTECRIKLESNLYFEEMVNKVRSFPTRSKCETVRILYVTEPTSVVAEQKYGDPTYFGYTEFEALDNYLRYLKSQATQVDTIRIRLHPSEPPGKYRSIVEQYAPFFSIEESRDNDLAVDCAWSDWMVGCQSMAMVIGVLSGKTVFSCTPHNGSAFILPYKEIKKLFQPSS